MACLCLTTIWHESQAQDAPKTPQDVPKMAQDASRIAQGRLKTPPTRSQTPPRRLKTRLRRPKTPPRCDFDSFLVPKWSQVDTKIASGSDLMVK